MSNGRFHYYKVCRQSEKMASTILDLHSSKRGWDDDFSLHTKGLFLVLGCCFAGNWACSQQTKKQVVGWLASQTDMLSSDWVILPDSPE